MAKVMMDSEIVEALATLAAHGIEAMKGKCDIKAFSDAELRMELLRRGHQVPELGKGVKYGPVTKEEEKNGYQVWLAAPAAPGIAPYEGIAAALEDFAKSRGLL